MGVYMSKKIIYLEPGEVFELEDNTKLIYVGDDFVCGDCYYFLNDKRCYTGVKKNASLYCKEGCCFKEIKSGL